MILAGMKATFLFLIAQRSLTGRSHGKGLTTCPVSMVFSALIKTTVGITFLDILLITGRRLLLAISV